MSGSEQAVAEPGAAHEVLTASCSASSSSPVGSYAVDPRLVMLAGAIFVFWICAVIATLVTIYRRSVIRDGKVGVFLPLFVHDFAAMAFFPLTFVISSLMYFQPTHSEWNNPNNFMLIGPEALKKKSGEDLSTLKKDIVANTSRVYSESDLVRLFDSLPAASPSTLLGKGFEGHILRTNKNLLDLVQMFIAWILKKIGISWGRRLVSHHRGDPVVLNFRGKLYLPLPAFGNLSTETCVWRDVSTACGRFNHLPWTDMYKVLEDDGKSLVLLVCWTNREKTGGWFTLTMDKSWPMTSTAPFS